MVKLTSLSCLIGFVTLAANAAPSTHIASASSSDKQLSAGRKIVDATPRHYNGNVKSHTFVTYVDTKHIATRGLQPAEAAVKLATSLTIAAKGAQSHRFEIRDDSYFDESHGLHHVYVKQSIHGLQIHNGGLHAVVSENGEILSYSHNLYTGPEPELPSNAAPLSTCQGAVAGGKRSQMTFTAPTVNSVLSADAALYGSMAVASPDPTMSLAFSEVAQAGHRASYLSSPIDAARSLKISGIPTTTGDIAASFAYVLDSNDCLLLTHRFEVPMEDNWYETYIDALSGEVRSVVDWVSPGSASKFSLARPDFSSYGSPILSKVEQGLKAAFDSVIHAADEVVAQLTTSSDEEEETKEPSYRVFQWGENDPSEGKRSYESARHDPEVSPFGWHAFPSSRKPFDVSSDKGIYKDGNLTKFKDTRGNNVFVSWGGKTSDDAWSVSLPRPQGEVINGSRHFGYPYPWRKFDLAHKPLDPKNYSLASQTQLFYTINEYHDLLHHYGFDGAAGNGEEYSEKGKDGDAIIAFAQSAAGLNNADMATPPDGMRGRMRMYSWSGQPMRDGSFESGIVLHEYTHFVSTRLTGGPSDSSCLGYGEAGGMGEGWGDIIATMARDRNGSTLAFSMGEWASNHTGGIRRWPYSRNITLDPDTYETLNKPGYWAVHQIGSVWATIVLDVVDHAMEELGFTPDLFPPAKDASKEAYHKFYFSEEELSSLPGVKSRKSKKPVPRHGNTLLLQLLIDGMKIQPCRPDFLAARDAIIKADEILTGGRSECLLKHAFAKRGLGTDARVVGSTPWGGGIRTNGHKVPSYCNGTHHK